LKLITAVFFGLAKVKLKLSYNLSLLTASIHKGPWTPKLSYHFPKKAQFSKNFDSNIDDLRHQCRKRDAMLTGWWRHHVYP